jgi:hypothetical protein
MAQPGSLNALAVARRVAAALVEDGLAYAIGGALALGAWGAPRATQDVDLTVFVAGDAADRVFDALERGGLMLDRVACRRDVDRIGMFKARAGRLFVDVFLAGHPQYAAMEARRVEIDDGAGGTLAFISAEDLCLHKLLFGRPKDVVDLERLLALRPTLDLAYVRGWLVQMVPAGDPRLDVLDDLTRRFAAP